VDGVTPYLNSMSASRRTLLTKLPPGQRRRSMVLAYANGGLWGTGTGLASVTLMIYLAKEYGVSAFGISWLVAAPSFAGLLRLFTPQWLERVGSRRKFCVAIFLVSATLLFALPIISAPQVLPLPGESITALAVTWAGYHVLEYMGTVALWSWFGDLVPRAIRGRFVGRREAWANVGRVLGTVAAAMGTYVWQKHCETIQRPDMEWRSYAACGLAGAVMFALSAWPLLLMSDLPLRVTGSAKPDSLRKQLISPWADKKFRRLLRFGLWFSFSNGLMQPAQWLLKTDVLQLSFVEKKSLDSGSRGMQALLMPWVGNWVDRRGNVSALVLSQSVIALAPLFLLLASPAARWWVIGAYFCWLAYAGENVAQPNLMLGLSPRGQTAAYASAWFAWTQLSYSVSALVGGALFDWLAKNYQPYPVAGFAIDHFALFFLVCWLLKSMGVFWASRILE